MSLYLSPIGVATKEIFLVFDVSKRHLVTKKSFSQLTLAKIVERRGEQKQHGIFTYLSPKPFNIWTLFLHKIT